MKLPMDTMSRRIAVTDPAFIVARLTAALKARGHLLVLSAYDGTLTPIVDDPERAVLLPEIRSDLRRLLASGRISLGVISGRTLDDLSAKIDVPGVIYAGCHGLEVSGPRLAFRHSGASARVNSLREVVDALARHSEHFPGVMVETKTLAVAVHYRRASAETLAALLDFLRLLLARQSGLRVLPGTEVLEILPAIAWDRGRCALWIESRVEDRWGPRVKTVYLGDHVTDEPAFRALRGRGITIKVGCAPHTSAAHRVLRVTDVHWILSALGTFLEGGDPV